MKSSYHGFFASAAAAAPAAKLDQILWKGLSEL
jgi:hypothetical protein